MEGGVSCLLQKSEKRKVFKYLFKNLIDEVSEMA